MGQSPKENQDPAHADHTAEPSPPYCLQVFLAFAYTNKLMIIAKESTTQQNTPQIKVG